MTGSGHDGEPPPRGGAAAEPVGFDERLHVPDERHPRDRRGLRLRHLPDGGLEFTEGVVPSAKPRRRGQRRSRARSAPAPAALSALCPNCAVRFDTPTRRALYCGLRCASEAGVVRYARKRRVEFPNGFPDDIRYAIRVQLAHALAGGYDKEARRLPTEIRAMVFARDDSQCVMCGDDGEEIDHISGSSPNLDNLRLLCRECHRMVTSTRMVPITDPETMRRRDALVERMEAAAPMRPCDDADWGTRWTAWRQENTVVV